MNVQGFVSSKNFFSLAMDTFRNKYNTDSRRVLFIMASDDVNWITAMFGNVSDIFLTASAPDESKKKQPTFDLVTLSLCNHTIFRYFLKHKTMMKL